MSKPQEAARDQAIREMTVKEKHIQYIGLADVRIIRKADWASIGIQCEDVKWYRGNNFTIPCEGLPQEVLEYCQHDPELVVKSL